MIRIEPYSKKFEEVYWEAVDREISYFTRERIMNSCVQYLPSAFWGNVPAFKDLILAPFEKLKMAQRYITRSSKRMIMESECFGQGAAGNKKPLKYPYDSICSAYGNVADLKENGASMRVRIVRNTGLTVCPYCNRDYINSRAEDASGAQLDHFFSKDEYPLFAVCLYNLVPVCGNCNRIKSNQSAEFASPFDSAIDWANAVKFSYSKRSKQVKITVKNSKKAIKNNIEKMKIREAYQIHAMEAEEFLEKEKTYSKTQRQEFAEVLHTIHVTEREIKQAIFGPEITEEAMKKKPLGKMMRDLQKKFEIY